MRSRWMMLLVVFTAMPLVADTRAYVWADQPTSVSYSPSPQYAYNPGGSVVIRRSSTGTYQVIFSGLGRPGGNVQVTAYGATTDICKVVNWINVHSDLSVNVRCFTATGTPADAQFTLLAMWPPDVPGPASVSAAPPKSPGGVPQPIRSMKPDGTVVLRYPDGHVVERSEGRIRFIDPNGKSSDMIMMEVTGAIPPTPPTDQEALWLTFHADRLLDVIKTIVNDPTTVNDYVRSEPSSIYEKITKRRDVLARLVQ